MSMEAKLRADMLTLIERYCQFMSVQPTTVCGWAQGDPRFYAKLKDDVLTFSAYSYDRVVSSLSERWPDGLDWPDGIPRIKPGDVKERARKERTPRAPKAAAEAVSEDASAG
jgi:hypothetical protein